MGRSTRRARSGRRGLLQAEDPLDLSKLGIGVLEDGGPLHEDVDSDAVTDRHLVDETAEIELQLGDARPELIAPALEIDGSVLLGQRTRHERWRGRPGGFAGG